MGFCTGFAALFAAISALSHVLVPSNTTMVMNVTFVEALPSDPIVVFISPSPTASSFLRGSTSTPSATQTASATQTPSATTSPTMTPSQSPVGLPASFVQLMNAFEAVYKNTIESYDSFVKGSDELSVYLYLSYAYGKQVYNLPSDNQIQYVNLCSRAMSIRTASGLSMTKPCFAYNELMTYFNSLYQTTLSSNNFSSYDDFVVVAAENAIAVHVNMFLFHVYARQIQSQHPRFNAASFMHEAMNVVARLQNSPSATPVA